MTDDKNATTEFKEIRLQLGISQREYGERLGISRDRVKDYERGRARLPADVYKNALALKEKSAKEEPSREETSFSGNIPLAPPLP